MHRGPMSCTGSERLPEIILFGDSLTEWSFNEETQGFGWYLEHLYAGKAEIANEGYAGYTSTRIKREFAGLIERQLAPGAPTTLLITIFLGANDACLVGKDENYVPLPIFEANIREFVETILTQDRGLAETKIVLLTPPPIGIPDPVGASSDEGQEDLGLSMVAALEAARSDPKQERGYKTYLSKRRYANKTMEIAAEYEETGKVIGLDFWTAVVDAGLEDQGRGAEVEKEKYEEDRWPGCGLRSAKDFEKGYFTDGLHLGPRGYKVLSKVLVERVVGKWPELAADAVGS